MIKIIEKNEEPIENVIKNCDYCNKEFSEEFINEKINIVKSRMKWAEDIDLEIDLVIYAKCPSCKKEVKIAERIYESPDEIIMKISL